MIKSWNRSGSPACIPTIDTRGMSVLPGLADMHVHLMILGHGDYEHWDTVYRSRFRAEISVSASAFTSASVIPRSRERVRPVEDSIPGSGSPFR